MTSPPYANNAIDYMRAHKFSLVWFGWKIADLTRIRAQYVGHDAISGLRCDGLPRQCEETLAKLADRDDRKALVLRRYFGEMTTVIWEMRRVLKRGRPAVIVVGSSKLRGLDVETHKGLAAIGEEAGFALAGIGSRLLDRDKRMMPARWGQIQQSQIEERMHKEYVIGLVKVIMPGRIEALRRAYHRQIANDVLRRNASGIPNNADSGSASSVRIAKGIVRTSGFRWGPGNWQDRQWDVNSRR